MLGKFLQLGFLYVFSEVKFCKKSRELSAMRSIPYKNVGKIFTKFLYGIGHVVSYGVCSAKFSQFLAKFNHRFVVSVEKYIKKPELQHFFRYFYRL